jgi:hypothetical protein
MLSPCPFVWQETVKWVIWDGHPDRRQFIGRSHGVLDKSDMMGARDLKNSTRLCPDTQKVGLRSLWINISDDQLS